MPIFRFPFFYNPYHNDFSSKTDIKPNINKKNNDSSEKFKHNQQASDNTYNNDKKSLKVEPKSHSKSDNNSYFFELFGIKLQFDDVLIICLLIFLYQEGTRDNELFFSLILLLLS